MSDDAWTVLGSLLPLQELQMTNTIQMHYGRCRSQCLWRWMNTSMNTEEQATFLLTEFIF